MKRYQNAGAVLEEKIHETGLPRELVPLLLKLTHARRGWEKRDIHEDGKIETAMQHVAKLVLATYAVHAPERWNIDRTTLKQQALIHELPEIKEVGGVDWIPGEISEEQKLMLERAQLERLLPANFPRRAEIIQLWEAYEKGGLASYLDKMDAVITAEYYALVNHGDRERLLDVADSFFHYVVTKKVDDKVLIAVMQTIRGAARATNGKTKMAARDIFPRYFRELKSR